MELIEQLFATYATYGINGNRQLFGIDQITAYWRHNAAVQRSVTCKILAIHTTIGAVSARWTAEFDLLDRREHRKLTGIMSLQMSTIAYCNYKKSMFRKLRTTPIRRARPKRLYIRSLLTPIILVAVAFAAVPLAQFVGNAFASYHWVGLFDPHLSIPLAVLIVELYVLVLMARESHERSDTINEFHEMTRRTQRSEYLLNLSTVIREVRSEALFTSTSMEVSTRSDGQKAILESVDYLKDHHARYKHRGLIARTQLALPGTIELLIRAPHIEIRLSDAVLLSRLRFFIRDREESVLGVAEGPPDLASEKKTTLHTRIKSRMLAEALANHFEVLWQQAPCVRDYLDSLITSASPATKREIRSWFNAVNCKNRRARRSLGDPFEPLCLIAGGYRRTHLAQFRRFCTGCRKAGW